MEPFCMEDEDQIYKMTEEILSVKENIKLMDADLVKGYDTDIISNVDLHNLSLPSVPIGNEKSRILNVNNRIVGKPFLVEKETEALQNIHKKIPCIFCINVSNKLKAYDHPYMAENGKMMCKTAEKLVENISKAKQKFQDQDTSGNRLILEKMLRHFLQLNRTSEQSLNATWPSNLKDDTKHLSTNLIHNNSTIQSNCTIKLQNDFIMNQEQNNYADNLNNFQCFLTNRSLEKSINQRILTAPKISHTMPPLKHSDNFCKLNENHFDFINTFNQVTSALKQNDNIRNILDLPIFISPNVENILENRNLAGSASNFNKNIDSLFNSSKVDIENSLQNAKCIFGTNVEKNNINDEKILYTNSPLLSSDTDSLCQLENEFLSNTSDESRIFEIQTSEGAINPGNKEVMKPIDQQYNEQLNFIDSQYCLDNQFLIDQGYYEDWQFPENIHNLELMVNNVNYEVFPEVTSNITFLCQNLIQSQFSTNSVSSNPAPVWQSFDNLNNQNEIIIEDMNAFHSADMAFHSLPVQ